MDEADARARLGGADAARAEKAEVADVLVDNEGTLDELEGQVDRLWSDLTGRGRLSPAPERAAIIPA